MPYDKYWKYYRLPTNSINKKKEKSKKDNIDNKKTKEDWFGSIILFTVLIKKEKNFYHPIHSLLA